MSKKRNLMIDYIKRSADATCFVVDEIKGKTAYFELPTNKIYSLMSVGALLIYIRQNNQPITFKCSAYPEGMTFTAKDFE